MANVIGKGFNAGAKGMLVGGAIGQAVGEHRGAGDGSAPLTPGQKGFLVLTADELVLTTAGGMVTLSPKEVLLRVPRQAVRSVEIGSGSFAQAMVVHLEDGASWELELPRPAQKKGKALAEALTR